MAEMKTEIVEIPPNEKQKTSEEEDWRVKLYRDLYEKFKDGTLVNPPLDKYFVRAREPIDLQSKSKSPGEILADYSRRYESMVTIRGLEHVTDPDTGEVKEGLVLPLLQYPIPWQE